MEQVPTLFPASFADPHVYKPGKTTSRVGGRSPGGPVRKIPTGKIQPQDFTVCVYAHGFLSPNKDQLGKGVNVKKGTRSLTMHP